MPRMFTRPRDHERGDESSARLVVIHHHECTAPCRHMTHPPFDPLSFTPQLTSTALTTALKTKFYLYIYFCLFFFSPRGVGQVIGFDLRILGSIIEYTLYLIEEYNKIIQIRNT